MSQQRKDHLEDLRENIRITEVAGGPPDFHPDLHLQVDNPIMKRSHVHDTSEKLSSSNPQIFKDHDRREHIPQPNEKQLENSKECHFSERPEKNGPSLLSAKGSVPFHVPVNSASAKLADSDEKLPSSQLLSIHMRAVESQPGLSSFAQSGLGEPCGPSDNCEVLEPATCRSLPPPLPPKKYAKSMAGSRSEKKESSPDLELSGRGKAKSQNLQKPAVSAPSQTGAETRLKESGQGKELTECKPRTRSSPSPDFQTPLDTGVAVVSKGIPQTGPWPTVPPPQGTVSLTTYFSVDNCMTDTYRLKYRQRPKLNFSESSSLSGSNKPQSQTEVRLKAVFHEDLQPANV